jgi:hypothetical protein
MDPTPGAIEVAAARWEQWIGAALRAERFRALATAAAARRGPRRPRREPPRTRSSLRWMLVASAVGYWLLR